MQKIVNDQKFCSNTVFSLYCKTRVTRLHAAKPLAFSIHFLFRLDQNHNSNLTIKIIKCEQILKKDSAPIIFKFDLKKKYQEKANNSPSYRCAAIKNKEIKSSQESSMDTTNKKIAR